MSRIVLTRHSDAERTHHLVVGYDMPLLTYFWQEFNAEPDPDPQSGEVDWDQHGEWSEIAAYAGCMPRELKSVEALKKSLPDQFHEHMTDEVYSMLREHQYYANCGNILVDMTEGIRR